MSVAAPVSNMPTASPSLYIGDLAAEITDVMLFEIFNAVGPVASVRVCRDAATRRSLGYAYVNFHKVDDAERALDTLNFTNIKGKPCRIMWSHRDPTLRKTGLGNIFINHLDKSVDNKMLNEYFSIFGNILSCKVATKAGTADPLGYGFVHFESEEAAQNAIQKVDGKVIAGNKVSVAQFKPKRERGSNKTFTNVFVKNLPGDMNRDTLNNLFSQYGTITSSIVSAERVNGNEKPQRSFGFVNFETPEQASAAVDALNNLVYDGKNLYVARAQKKEEREKQLRESFEQRKQERQKKNSGVNLYIKYLADTIDDEALRKAFDKFGMITSAKVMRDEKNNSKGFGFVCFSTPDEATKAVTEMNGHAISQADKPLYVALHQRKDQRLAQNQALNAKRQQQFNMNNMMPQQMMMNMMPQQMMYPMNNRNVYYGNQMNLRNGGVYVNNQNRPQSQMMRNGMNPMMNNPMGMNPMMNSMNQQMNYQLMPAGRQQGMQRGGQRRPNQMGNNQRPMMNQQQMPQQQQQQIPQQQQPKRDQPLTAQLLAQSPPEMQKRLIGEKLFPMIKAQQPDLAGKITGMLLEMDNSELLLLLESQPALNEKITEAISVLGAATKDE